MPTPFILIFGLTVATCVIAYWSDNLGKKLGKKRISLLGLRPRQTATLITMVSSWGIMILTLVVLLVASPSLKDALWRYDRVNESNKQARALNEELGGRNQKLARKNRQFVIDSISLKNQQGRLLKQVQTIKASRRQSEELLRKARGNLRLARRSESAAKRSAASARRQSASAQRRLAQASRRFANVQSQFKLANLRLQQSQVRLKKINRQLEAGNRRLLKAQQDLNTAKVEYAKARRANEDLKKLNKQYDNENIETLKKLNKANLDFIEAQRNYDELKAGVQVLQNQREELVQITGQYQQVADQLKKVTAQLSTGKVSFRGGQVLTERLLPTNLGFSETRRQLTSLIAEARQIVEKTKTSDGAQRDIELTLPVDGGLSVSEADIIQQVANYLGLLNASASVRIVVAWNHAEADPLIFANIRVVPVETKFTRGETITTGIIDGSLGDAGVFNQLLALVNGGEEIARDKGIDPVPTAENPYFYSNTTNERIFEALHKIQAVGKKVQVRLLAADNLTTVDPLRIHFEIVTPTA